MNANMLSFDEAYEKLLGFARPVRGVRDERTGSELGDGSEFRCEWTQNEAVVLSFKPASP